MSDTKIQINNNKNRAVIKYLKELYKKDKSIRNEIRFVEKWKEEGQIYISFGTFRYYDIHWGLKILKENLIINNSEIKSTISELVIC